jgi:polar amino acid transport system substrate-binding protein
MSITRRQSATAAKDSDRARRQLSGDGQKGARTRSRRGVLSVLSLAGVLALAACSAGSPQAAGAKSASPPKPVLTDGINVGFPPFEYYSSSNEIIGSDIDLATALAGQAGFTLKIVNTSFTSIIPGIAAGRYNVGISGFTDTKQREKVVNFVDYLEDGTSLLVKKGNPGGLGLTNNTICGKSVALVEASSQLQLVVPIVDKSCKTAGKPAPAWLILPEAADPPLAVTDGRAIAALIDTASGAYLVKTSPAEFQLAPGPQLATEPMGLAVSKGSGLASRLEHALQQLIENGTYRKILRKWGLTSGAVTSASINAAGG